MMKVKVEITKQPQFNQLDIYNLKKRING